MIYGVYSSHRIAYRIQWYWFVDLSYYHNYFCLCLLSILRMTSNINIRHTLRHGQHGSLRRSYFKSLQEFTESTNKFIRIVFLNLKQTSSKAISIARGKVSREITEGDIWGRQIFQALVDILQGALFRILRSTDRNLARHSDNWQSMAVPRRIQCSGGCELGSQIAMMKLVEWPVVDRTPFLSVVL